MGCKLLSRQLTVESTRLGLAQIGLIESCNIEGLSLGRPGGVGVAIM